MISTSSLLKPLAVALLVGASAGSQAAVTVYTTQASFMAAVSSPGVDTYAGFLVGAGTASPVSRSAGAYTYSAATNTSSFFGAGTSGDPWLSTNVATDTITFSSFGGGPRAIGGNFFGVDFDGMFRLGNVTLVATDSLGAISTQTITGATVSSFLGFVTNGSLVSLVLSASQAGGTLWPAADNLTLAVPEPGTYALLLAGLGAVGWLARRRR